MKKRDAARRLGYAFGRLGIGLCAATGRNLPFRLLYPFSQFLAGIGYAVAVKPRAIAQEGLTKAFGRERPPREIRRIARACFYSMTATAVEFFMFMRHPERIREFVAIEGLEHLDRALAKGRGVIALSAHFGSFPLLLSRLSLEGYKVHAMLRHVRDAYLDRLFEEERHKIGVGSIYIQPRDQCVARTLEALRKNEVVFIQMDQNFGTGGVFVDFFGVKAATATGPVVFSLRTGAALVPMFIYRLEGPRHRIVIEPELEIGDEGSQEDRTLRMVQRATTLIEGYIRKHPHEWGWIHKRWKARPKEERG